MLAHVPSFGRNPRGSPDFLAYPVPKACMHVLGTRVPRRLGVARSASSPKAALALGCSLTPGLRISFGRVTCMARAASVPGLWALGFLLLACVGGWVRVAVGRGFCFHLPVVAGVLGVCVWARFVVLSLFCRLFVAFVVGLWCRPAFGTCVVSCALPLPPGVSGSGVRCGCACWVRVSAGPRPSWLGCRGVFFALFFFFCSFFFFRLLDVPVPGLVVSPPVSFLFGWAAGFFFFGVSACFGAPFPGGPLFLAWCCRFLLGGPPVPVWGSCLRCPLGGGFGLLLCFWRAVWWLWALFARPPFPRPLFFFLGRGGGGAAWLFLPLPSLGWRLLCGWCVVWLVPRHSWRRFLCATPRHSWLGFAAGGGGRSPPLLAGVRWRWWCVVCGVWRWCVGGIVAGVWCGRCLATPGGGSCVLLPATPGWVSLPLVVGGPRHSWLGSVGGVAVWCVVCGGGVLVRLWLVCGVVGPSPLLAEVPVCYFPPLLAGFRCRWWWAVPATPGWGPLAAVVCGVWCVVCGVCSGGVLVGLGLVCGVWWWCVVGVVVGVWPVAVVCCWGCGWCVVWLVPRHSWRRSLCATPRHSWLGFAAGGGGWYPPLLAGVGWRRWCVVCGVWCVGGVPGHSGQRFLCATPRHSWLGFAGGGAVWCVVCGVWRWCVVGVVVGVWCGWSLATPGGGPCVLLPATPGWVSLPVVLGGPRHSWLGSAGGGGVWCVVCGVWRWCVVGVVVGVWCGWSLATPGGGPCVLLPATPGWVSLPVVVGGSRHSWLGSVGGGGLWCVVCWWGPSPLLAEVPVCYSPALLAGFRCRWWWAVPATPGWGPLAAVACGVCSCACFAWPGRAGRPPGRVLVRLTFSFGRFVFLLLLPFLAGCFSRPPAAWLSVRSRLVCVSRLAVGCSLVVAPPPPSPFVSRGFRRSCLVPWCFCFFFFFFLLPLLPLCAPVVSGFLWFPAQGALGLGACVVCFVCLLFLGSPRVCRSFVLSAWLLAALAWLLPPPPLFVFRSFRSCRSVLCAVWCCASLGAVLRRAAARCVARCSAVVCCVALVWCRCLLRRALWRRPSPWGPVLCGAVFCGVPPRCVLCAVCVFVVAPWCVLLFAALPCAVCVSGCCAVRSLCSPFCAVLCFAVLVRSCCAVRVVRAAAGAWCCGALLCVVLFPVVCRGAVLGLVARGCLLVVCFGVGVPVWPRGASLWLVWFAVVPCFPVSCSVVLCCRVVLCCCALLSCCGAVGACFALLWAVVLCCVVLLVGCAVFGPVVVSARCGAVFLVLCVPCLLRSVRCGALLCWLWCPASLCRVLWRCAVVWCCAVVLCCRFAVLVVLALPSCGLSCGASVVCAVVGASCCGVSLCVVVSPWAFCDVVVLLWCVVVSCCAVRCPVVSCALCRVLRCRAALRCCVVCFSFCPVFLC